MKTAIPALALVTLLFFAFDASAGPADKGEAKDSGAQRRQGRPGQNGFQIDMSQMARRAMQQFDKDGDSKLDVRELTAMMTALRDRRMGNGQMGAGRPGGDRSKMRPGQRPGESQAAGGEKPKRPPIED